MNRPNQTLPELLAEYPLLSDPSLAAFPVFIVGVRGYYKRTMGDPAKNDRGIYDDAIFLISKDRVFMACNGNTDPSRFIPGVATLVPGIHIYKRGKHGISHPDGGYPAFRPASPDESVPVMRDGKPGIFKGIAINIHHGSQTSTSSLGCQTTHPDQWLDFQTTAYREMDHFAQTRIPYVLVEHV